MLVTLLFVPGLLLICMPLMLDKISKEDLLSFKKMFIFKEFISLLRDISTS